MIASMATAVFPVCLSPIISSLCPLPIGMSESIDFKPVCIGSLTDCLGIIPGAFTSTLFLSLEVMAPFPSIGFPKPSTTLPRSSLPTGTSTIAFVLYTTSAFSYSCPMLWGEVDELLKTAKDSGKTAAQIKEVQTLRDEGKKAHDEGNHEMSEIILNKALAILKG